ncbi:MAG: hypothetical protein M2R45_01484 [Verrucomicrobia subdivision 3 bacterium]|nr:hypothetical protein [Limisphaerales bacterium]MCS1413386.1 hypothetical protein [Limisphaerales bacterium]
MMAAVAGPSENQGNRRAAFGWLKPDAVLCAYSLGAETNPAPPKESQRLNLENPAFFIVTGRLSRSDRNFARRPRLIALAAVRIVIVGFCEKFFPMLDSCVTPSFLLCRRGEEVQNLQDRGKCFNRSAAM